jgi:hypothetical protein
MAALRSSCEHTVFVCGRATSVGACSGQKNLLLLLLVPLDCCGAASQLARGHTYCTAAASASV